MPNKRFALMRLYAIILIEIQTIVMFLADLVLLFIHFGYFVLILSEMYVFYDIHKNTCRFKRVSTVKKLIYFV